MQAITLWQPWASFIAIGVKPYETRHWPAPARLVGQRIAIHAARRRVEDDDIAWWHEIAGSDEPLPRGAIVCTALLRAVVPADQVSEDRFGDYEPGRWAWHLTEIFRTEPPVPARGAQGFWLWREACGGADE